MRRKTTGRIFSFLMALTLAFMSVKTTAYAESDSDMYIQDGEGMEDQGDAETEDAESADAETEDAESADAETEDAETEDTESGDDESENVESADAESEDVASLDADFYIDAEYIYEDSLVSVSDDYASSLFNVPYISTYYFNPKPTTEDFIKIPLYLTDFEQSEYLKGATGITLDLLYEVDDYEYEIDDVPLGDYTLEIGYLSEGTHVFSVQVRDNRTNLTSHKLYNELWVVDPGKYDITEEQTYYMTEADLVTYKISNNNSTDATDMVNTVKGLNRLFLDVKARKYKKIVLLKGTYRINGEDRTGNRANSISIPSYFTVDMNGATFKLNPILTDIDFVKTQNASTTASATGCIVIMDSVIDAHLTNGTLEGDRFERQEKGLETVSANRAGMGEGINTVVMKGGKYCSISNMTIKDTTGHSVIKFYEWGENLYLDGYTPTVIVNGKEEKANNCRTSAMMDLTKIIERNKSDSTKYVGENYIYVGHPEGYRGIYGFSPIVYVSFYNDKKEFIETVTGYQYRKMMIPDGAKYARVTLLGTNFMAFDGSNPESRGYTVSIYTKHFGDYFEFTDIDFIDTRTCALAPANCCNLLIEGCTYTRCGNSITPAAVDFEDGAQECQDIFYRNNTVLEAAGTVSFIDNYGFNHVLENNTNHSYEVRNRVTGGVIRGINDETSTVTWRLGDQAHAAYGRIYNNNSGIINVTDDMGDRVTKELNPVNFIVKDCVIHGGCLDSAMNYVTYENCVFHRINGGNATLRNCTVQFDYAVGSFVGSGIHCYDCTFEALDGSATHNINWNQAVNADRIFENCKFLGKTVPNSFLASGVFRNCEFEDISITGWASQSADEKVLFENCSFYSSGGFFFCVGPISSYEGYINYTFKDCNITHTGTNLVQVTAKAIYDGSQVVFDHCAINKAVNTSVNPTVFKVINEIPTLDTQISGYSVSLSDIIALNFHIKMADSVRNNGSAIVRFSLPGGKIYDVKASSGIADKNNAQTYIYTCEVPASQMVSDIYAQVMVTSNGSVPSQIGEAYKCNVRSYAKKVIDNASEYDATTDQVAMLRAMLNYGGYAQKYFGINIYNLASSNVYSQATNPVNNVISGIASKEVSSLPGNSILSYVGASLVCDGTTELKLYYSINGSIDKNSMIDRLKVSLVSGNKNCTCEGKVVNGMYVITVYGITASQLDDEFKFTVTDKSSSTNNLSFSYSPVNYIASAQKSSNQDLVNLTRALYYYNQAANKL